MRLKRPAQKQFTVIRDLQQLELQKSFAALLRY
jgi:hypothetical protein